MITILCEEISSRVKYTFDLVFHKILTVEYELTDDQSVYDDSNHTKFTYGTSRVGEGLFFKAAGLLTEEHISAQNLQVEEYQGYPAFYQVEEPSALGIDLFSAIFYLVSRYEEYLPHEVDQHGRYLANQSIAFKNNFLEIPIVDIWAQLIGERIQQTYPDLVLGKRDYRYINTIDIDNAYAYSGKGSVRTVGGIAKSVLRLDKEDISDRVEVLSGKGKDPYDTYAYMKKIATANNSEVKSFILLGDYGPYDKNLPHSSSEQIQAVNQMAEFSEVGMHPSYESGANRSQVQKEQSRLADILQKPVTSSRQHYLKLKLPDTYRVLIQCEITEDHSMGYGEAIGFRAGTCTPFNFFDLEANVATPLTVYPFAVMDRTVNDYMKLSPKEAIERITKLTTTVKEVNGTLISVWHNESLSDEKEWKGWLPVYEYLQSNDL